MARQRNLLSAIGLVLVVHFIGAVVKFLASGWNAMKQRIVEYYTQPRDEDFAVSEEDMDHQIRHACTHEFQRRTGDILEEIDGHKKEEQLLKMMLHRKEKPIIQRKVSSMRFRGFQGPSYEESNKIAMQDGRRGRCVITNRRLCMFGVRHHPLRVDPPEECFSSLMGRKTRLRCRMQRNMWFESFPLSSITHSALTDDVRVEREASIEARAPLWAATMVKVVGPVTGIGLSLLLWHPAWLVVGIAISLSASLVIRDRQTIMSSGVQSGSNHGNSKYLVVGLGGGREVEIDLEDEGMDASQMMSQRLHLLAAVTHGQSDE